MRVKMEGKSKMDYEQMTYDELFERYKGVRAELGEDIEKIKPLRSRQLFIEYLQNNYSGEK